jgi:hypothetical protein
MFLKALGLVFLFLFFFNLNREGIEINVNYRNLFPLQFKNELKISIQNLNEHVKK